MTREEELQDIRAELKALSSLGIWDQPAESCDEKTMLRRRRWSYLDDRLSVIFRRGERIMVVKIFKTIVVLTIMIPATWMMIGVVLLAITAK